MQTNHAKGITKSLGYSMTSLPAIGSSPGKIKVTNVKGKVLEKDNKGIGSHWEHALQLLNQTNRFVDLLSKHKGITSSFKKGLKDILDVSDQHLIPKNGQLFNDAKGPTTFTKSYLEMLKMGIDNPLLNVFANKYAKLENNFIVSGKNKGRSLLDVQLENINLNIAKKALSKLSKKEWGVFEHNLSNKIKNKSVDINNKALLSTVIGKKAAKMLRSQDIQKTIKDVDKALELGRKLKKKKRGASVWDFDDTIARTKSGVLAQIPNPSGKPMPKRKVIFMAGGPGAGKSTAIKGLGLEKQGFKIVNQDISLQWLAKNHGLPTNMRDFTSKQRSKWASLQWEARGIAQRKQIKFEGKGDGIIVDGTGANKTSMMAQMNAFKRKGYDVSMVFVETSLPTALARNKARKERSLTDKIVERTWKSVIENKKAYTEMFGENFIEIKSDKLKMGDAMPKDVIAKADKFTKSYEKIRLTAEEFASNGKEILDKGGKFDFSEFELVREGEPGPFFEKFVKRMKKYGPEDNFILTARPPESAPHIHMWLKMEGYEIPLKNIKALGNSTAEAKALWMLEKYAEGYNDLYFADDALANVKEVKNVLSQLDIKSKVQQALASKDINKEINDIMEHSLNIESGKVFSKAEGKVRGKDIKRRRFFMTDSAADLELLIEPLYGKGKEGIKNKKWFSDNFIQPWERGIRDYNIARQTAKTQYMSLRKQNKDVVKVLPKEVEGTNFTVDQAMRVYLWNKAGYNIPDLAKTTETKLIEYIQNNPKLQVYAENFAKITKQEKGLKEPGQNWWAETMAGEVTNIDRGVSRKQYLQEFIDIKNEIFSEQNLNKMESKLGTRWRENIEDMFDRMETGRTRSLKMDRGSTMMMNYLNGSIGTIMNFNTRSAALQTISTTNFLNMRENNPIAAAVAMGNVKQFSKDFMYIMNSPMLKQRRDGLEINVTEAEIASAATGSKNPINAMIAKVLKHGYLPTKLADSFAISFGGATFYRNRIKMYKKQGMSIKEAEKKAWLDFQTLSERTQQSSRPDLLSRQQTSLIGRFILPFANTPMQMNRLGIKEILDLSKGRYKDNIEAAEKMGRASYYMGIQIALFAGLQSALFAMLLNNDDVAEEKIEKTKTYTLNTVSDSFLRGMGVPGAVASGFKNSIIAYAKESEKGINADYSEIGEALLNISPPVGSKFGKLDAAGNILKYDRKQIEEEGFRFELGNPSLEASSLAVEAITNIPVNRAYKKTSNIIHSLNSDYENWQRAHMLGGWTPWNVGIESEKIKEKKKEKEKKKKKKKKSKSSLKMF
jgi:predicted kinase/predicted DNA-binding protein